MTSLKNWFLSYYKTCQSCGTINPESYNYCRGCGKPLG